MASPRTAPLAALTAALLLLLSGGPARAGLPPGGAAPGTRTAGTAPAVLPAVRDATGLPGAGMVPAPRVALPGADARGVALVRLPSGRRYLLAPARRVVPGQRPGLLVVLVAAYSPVSTVYARDRLDAFRDHGLAVVLPVPHGANWNAGACCGRPWREGVNDIAFLGQVKADATRRAGAAGDRVAVAGHSAGALLAWRVACTPLLAVRAVVAVAGALVHPCPSALVRTPRALALAGALDRSVPPSGSRTAVPLLGVAVPPLGRSARVLAAAGRCRAPGTRRVLATTVTDWTGCSAGGSVRVQVVDGRGHAWQAVEGTRRTARFLSQVLGAVR